MGYYTKYDLEIPNENFTAEVEDALLNFDGGYGRPFLYEVWRGEANDIKWYEHEEDMKEFSKQFPDIVFTLSGEGEESGDIWKKYFKNGKMQVAKAVLTFPTYDEKKLK